MRLILQSLTAFGDDPPLTDAEVVVVTVGVGVELVLRPELLLLFLLLVVVLLAPRLLLPNALPPLCVVAVVAVREFRDHMKYPTKHMPKNINIFVFDISSSSEPLPL